MDGSEGRWMDFGFGYPRACNKNSKECGDLGRRKKRRGLSNAYQRLKSGKRPSYDGGHIVQKEFRQVCRGGILGANKKNACGSKRYYENALKNA